LQLGVFVVLSVSRGPCCSYLKIKVFVPPIAGRVFVVLSVGRGLR
jgi:hypothetical protein